MWGRKVVVFADQIECDNRASRSGVEGRKDADKGGHMRAGRVALKQAVHVHFARGLHVPTAAATAHEHALDGDLQPAAVGGRFEHLADCRQGRWSHA